MKLGKLYVVATPIGNLTDMTYRALQTIQSVGAVFCEDVRESRALLADFLPNASQLELFTYQKGGDEKALQMLLSGQDVCIVSDRGTPCISDPGSALVSKCVQEGVCVVPVPGSCAATALMSVSGFGGRFLFYGFLPKSGQAQVLEKLRSVGELGVCVVFFESPARIRSLISLLGLWWPGCQVCVGRELTKKFETIYRGLAEDNSFVESLPQRGEYTIVVRMQAGISHYR